MGETLRGKTRGTNFRLLDAIGKLNIPKELREKYKMDNTTLLELKDTGMGILITVVPASNEQARHEAWINDKVKNKKGKTQMNKKYTYVKKEKPKFKDKCSLCGVTSNLVMYDDAAYCNTCIRRVK